MAALMFWSMKNRSDNVKPRPMEVSTPVQGSRSMRAHSKWRSTRGGNFSTVFLVFVLFHCVGSVHGDHGGIFVQL